MPARSLTCARVCVCVCGGGGVCVSQKSTSQRLSGNEVRGITGENRLRCVCFSFDLSSLFQFWKANNRSVLCCSLFQRTEDESLLSHQSFPLSSEARKRWLVALRRDEGANFRVTNTTVLCSEHFLPTHFHFPAHAQASLESPSTIMANRRRPVAS